MERNRRTTLQGVVVSNKMDKTIVVEVETHKRHAKYQKRVKYSNKYYAHDEKNEAKVGDTVTIMASRPLSALKRFRLVSVDKKAQVDIKVLEAEKELEIQAEEAVKGEEPKVEEPKVEEAPKAEPAKEEAPVVEEKAAPKKAPAKKAPAKKAAAKEEVASEKAPAKKPAAKKAPAKKAAAKKAE